MPEAPALFMRFFVELVYVAARRKRLENGDFAHLVWPELTERSAEQRWLYVRMGAEGKGRPTFVTLEDAWKMAQVLGQDPLVLFLRAKDQVIQSLEEAENEGQTGFKVRERKPPKSDN